MMKKSKAISSPFLISILIIFLSSPSNANNSWFEGVKPVVKRTDERTSILKTEFGEISAVDFKDGSRFGYYHLQFITIEPNSLFLPVFLHANMVFYVHTGSGRLNWIVDDELREVYLRRGDIYGLHPGSIFYLRSSLEPEREKFRIYALFSSTDEDFYDPSIGAYSSVTDLVRGFDKKVLLEAFRAPEEVIEEIMNTTKPPLIVHATTTQSEKLASTSTSSLWELESRFLKGFFGEGTSGMGLNKKKKKGVYNIYEAAPDFENCNGWSLTVTKKVCHSLKGSNVGLFVVNLTAGSMMSPHWNPRAWEIGIVTSEEPGVVQVGSSSRAKSPLCTNSSFILNKGDVFVVPRFYPMTQMSFNNGSFAFVGFSTTNRRNEPQFLAGSSSVLQIMDREVLAWSFDVNVTTIDRLLGARVEPVILECISCAEEEARKIKEEKERERQEEEEKKREEEERKREEEEEKRKREEEEERKKREEEERKRKEEEEEARREEEKREKEEERKREEEREIEREEEEKRKKEEEERKRQEEEEERKREEEREIEREEEEKRKKEEQERKRQEEQKRRREEEERKRREEEEREIEREEEEEKEEEEASREEERRRKEEQEQEQAEQQEEEERKGEEEQRKKREEEEKEKEEESFGSLLGSWEKQIEAKAKAEERRKVREEQQETEPEIKI